MTSNNQENLPTEENAIGAESSDITNEQEKEAISKTSATTSELPSFGWSSYAERVNGRFAMLGLAAVLLIEALSRDAFLHWAGLVP